MTTLQPSPLTALIAAARLAIAGELAFAPDNRKGFVELLLIIKVSLRPYFINRAMVEADIWPLLRGEGKAGERLFDTVMKMTQAFDLEVQVDGLNDSLVQSLTTALSYNKNRSSGGKAPIIGMDTDTADKLAAEEEVREILTNNPPVRFLLFCNMFMSRLGYLPEASS